MSSVDCINSTVKVPDKGLRIKREREKYTNIFKYTSLIKNKQVCYELYQCN